MDEPAPERLRSALEDIAEELADMARAQLLDALHNHTPGAEAAERRLSRARRAVLKAAALLRPGGGSEGGEDELA